MSGAVPIVVSMFKRYRYRAYPTGDQVKHLARVFECTRVVYNDVIAARESARRNGESMPTAGELSKRLLTKAKRTPQRAWLAEVSSVPLQQSLRDADRAYRNYFNALAKSGNARGSGLRDSSPGAANNPHGSPRTLASR